MSDIALCCIVSETVGLSEMFQNNQSAKDKNRPQNKHAINCLISTSLSQLK